MLKKVITSIFISSIIFCTSNAGLYEIGMEAFNGLSNNGDISEIDSEPSDEMSCGSIVLPNSTTNESILFDCDMNIGANFDALNGSTIEVKGDLKIASNAEIEGSLIVHGNLETGSNLTIGKNLVVTGNITGENSNIDVAGYTMGKNIVIGSNLKTQAVVSTGYVSLGSNSIIEKGIITDGYLMTGSNFDLKGISLIRGEFVTGSNFDGSGTIYIYGDLTGGSNFDFNGTKLKVTTNFKIDSNGTNKGRIFVYGKKEKGVNYDEIKENYGYLIGEIDPLLKYNLSNSEFNTIKSKTIKSDKRVYNYKIAATELNNYLNQLHSENSDNSKMEIINKKTVELNGLKQSTINEYSKLFEYLDKYIENEAFDINTYNELKQRRMENLNTFLNSMHGSSTNFEIKEITKQVVKVKKNIEEETIEKDEKQDQIKDEKEDAKKEKVKVVNKKIEEKKIEKISSSLASKIDTALSKIPGNDIEKTYKKIILKIDNMLDVESEEELKVKKETLLQIKQYLESELQEIDIINQIFG